MVKKHLSGYGLIGYIFFFKKSIQFSRLFSNITFFSCGISFATILPRHCADVIKLASYFYWLVKQIDVDWVPFQTLFVVGSGVPKLIG